MWVPRDLSTTTTAQQQLRVYWLTWIFFGWGFRGALLLVGVCAHLSLVILLDARRLFPQCVRGGAARYCCRCGAHRLRVLCASLGRRDVGVVFAVEQREASTTDGLASRGALGWISTHSMWGEWEFASTQTQSIYLYNQRGRRSAQLSFVSSRSRTPTQHTRTQINHLL